MGISETRIENVHALAKGYVDRGAFPGYACIVSSGDDVWFRAYGMRDVENALAGAARHDIPHLFDDQTHHQRRTHDAV